MLLLTFPTIAFITPLLFTNLEWAVSRKFSIKSCLPDCNIKDDASTIAPLGQRYIDTMYSYHKLYTIRTIILINQLAYNLVRTLSCTYNYYESTSLQSSSCFVHSHVYQFLLYLIFLNMFRFIALENCVICCLLSNDNQATAWQFNHHTTVFPNPHSYICTSIIYPRKR